jgi:hypothetical protein
MVRFLVLGAAVALASVGLQCATVGTASATETVCQTAVVGAPVQEPPLQSCLPSPTEPTCDTTGIHQSTIDVTVTVCVPSVLTGP